MIEKDMSQFFFGQLEAKLASLKTNENAEVIDEVQQIGAQLRKIFDSLMTQPSSGRGRGRTANS